MPRKPDKKSNRPDVSRSLGKGIDQRKRKPYLTQAEILHKVGEQLKYHRKNRGFTSYENFVYESNIGIGRTQYGRYENGGNIQLKTLVKILRALDVTLAKFFSTFGKK